MSGRILPQWITVLSLQFPRLLDMQQLNSHKLHNLQLRLLPQWVDLHQLPSAGMPGLQLHRVPLVPNWLLNIIRGMPSLLYLDSRVQ